MDGFLSRLPEVEKTAGIDPTKHAVVALKDQQDAQHVFRILREARASDTHDLEDEDLAAILRIIGRF